MFRSSSETTLPVRNGVHVKLRKSCLKYFVSHEEVICSKHAGETKQPVAVSRGVSRPREAGGAALACCCLLRQGNPRTVMSCSPFWRKNADSLLMHFYDSLAIQCVRRVEHTTHNTTRRMSVDKTAVCFIPSRSSYVFCAVYTRLGVAL